MDENELRRILVSCKEPEVEETRMRADSALRAGNAIKAVRATSDETVDWLMDTARLLKFDLSGVLRTPVWVVPNPLVGAYVNHSQGEDDIVVHEGTFQTMAFLIWFWMCMFKTKALLDQARLAPKDRAELETHMDNALTLAVPLVVRNLREPTRFPDLRPGLSRSETNVAAGTLVAADLFMLLHEQAHVDLGHMVGRSGPAAFRSEFAVAEGLNTYKEDELAADQRALESAPSPVRGFLASGAIWFLTTVLYYEAFLKRVSNAHPLAVNRMRTIVDRYGGLMSESDRHQGENFIALGRSTIESGQRFANVPEPEKLNVMFRGRHPNYAADFLEWFFPFAQKFLTERSA